MLLRASAAAWVSRGATRHARPRRQHFRTAVAPRPPGLSGRLVLPPSLPPLPPSLSHRWIGSRRCSAAALFAAAAAAGTAACTAAYHPVRLQAADGQSSAGSATVNAVKKAAAAAAANPTRNVVVTTTGDRFELATWGQCCRAYVYNCLVTLARQVVLITVPAAALRLLGVTNASNAEWVDAFTSGVITLGLLVYQQFFEQAAIHGRSTLLLLGGQPLLNGQNLGMRWAGIRVVREDGQPVDVPTLVWLWLGHIALPFTVAYRLLSNAVRRRTLQLPSGGAGSVLTNPLSKTWYVQIKVPVTAI